MSLSLNVCTQTPEQWTLRDIQQHLHSGGNISHLKETFESGTPPPIPARRQISHPPNNDQGTPSLTSNIGMVLPHIAQISEKPESRSAPSSPSAQQKHLFDANFDTTNSSKSFSIGNLSPSSSPQARPRSAMLETSMENVKYTSVSFPAGHDPRTFLSSRRDTKYSEIVHPDANAIVDSSPLSNVSVTNEHVKSLERTTSDKVSSNPLYETFPTCIQLEGQDDTNHVTETSPQPVKEDKKSPRTSPELPGNDPFPSDPFTSDPFSNDAMQWDDSSAFYDRPPPPRPYIPGQSVPSPNESALVKTKEKLDDTEIASFSVDSQSYEDTLEFLKNCQLKHRAKDNQLLVNRSPSPQKYPESKNQATFAPVSQGFLASDKHAKENASVPPVKPTHVDTNAARQSPTGKTIGAYEYPVALDKFPSKKSEDDRAPAVDEPPLHFLNYTSKGQPSGVTRHESLSRSRRGMPLPPVPDLKEQAPQNLVPANPPISPPPLPARPRETNGPSATQRPALPPYNYPGGNKKPRSEDQPPLPPRRKEPSPNSNGGGSTSEIPPEKNAAVFELLALGYTQSEIDRALLVSNNNLALAKLILKEFGGRH